MKQGIIYILILAIISGSIGPETIALADGPNTATETVAVPEASTENQIPPEPLTKVVVTDPAEVAQAVTEVSNGEGTFGISPESKAELEKALSIKDQEQINKSAWVTLQSMVTSFVILAIGVLHQNAHQSNLNMVPENEKALAESVGGLWPAFINVLANAPGGFVAYKLSQGASKIIVNITETIFRTPAALWMAKFIPYFNAAAAQRLFKYLVSGGLLSIGSDYVKGFVIFSAQEVLAHPDVFGGVSKEEAATLQYLKTQAGFGYFLGSLAYMGTFHYGGKIIPNSMPALSPEKKAHYETFFNVDAKVLKAMGLVLQWNSDIRDVLWHHLFRQAFLQGRNGLVIFFSIVSDVITEMWADKTATVKGFDKRGLIISVGVGLVASFMPSRVKDIGTSEANSNWAALQTKYEKWKINRELQNFNYHQSEDGLVKDLTSIFSDEQASRENRFVKFAYLAQLALTRTGNLQNEKLHILADQYQKSQGNQPKAQGVKEWTDYIYRQILDPKLMPDSWTIGWDNSDINYYKSLYQSSVSSMMQIYIDETSIYQKIGSLNWPPKAQELIAGQLKNFQQMEVFINYMNQILLEQWNTTSPDATFTDTQSAIEKISFWGLQESDVLRVFINGSIVNH